MPDPPVEANDVGLVRKREKETHRQLKVAAWQQTSGRPKIQNGDFSQKWQRNVTVEAQRQRLFLFRASSRFEIFVSFQFSVFILPCFFFNKSQD